MLDSSLKIGLALLPILLVYALYLRYFRLAPRFNDHLEAFLAGIILAALLLLLNSFLQSLLPISKDNIISKGFLRAALIEKAGASVAIYLLLKRKKEDLIIVEAILSSMLLGIGFSTVENIFYALDDTPMLILVRFLSAVPLHMTTCAMIGYFMALFLFSQSKYMRYRFLFLALWVPFLLHGSFDTLLLYGGQATYLIGPLLVALMAFLEYILSRSQTLPSLQTLLRLEISYEDWSNIQREPQYERWILQSMGSRNSKHTSFFQWQLGLPRKIAILLLLVFAIAVLPFSESIRSGLQLPLKHAEFITLVSVLPLAFSFNLVVLGLVNPMYFRNSLIKIPIIADVEISDSNQTMNAITYDITSTGCFLKTVESLPYSLELELKFICPSFVSPVIRGKVVWDNHEDPKHPSGTMLHFNGMPEGFAYFLLRYNLFKFSRGLVFNLRIPGFEILRKLFVRPQSIMQTEQKIKAGQIIFEEGQKGAEFYLIRKGEVEIYKTSSNDSEVCMARLGPGEIFGELALVGDQTRAASARCLSDCVLAVADGDNLDVLIENNPGFTKRLIELLAHRLISSESIMSRQNRELEQKLEGNHKLMHSAMILMLIASGIKPVNNMVNIKTNLAFLRDYFYLKDETVRAMFDYLMRYENMQNLELTELEDYLSKELLQAYNKYHLIIEDGSAIKLEPL